MRLLLTLVLLAASQFTLAEETIAGTFGDWTKICVEDDTGKFCRLGQTATDNKTGKQAFQTSIGYVPNNEDLVVFFTAPLGIFLPRGITLALSAETVLFAEVQVCDASGCQAVAEMPPGFVAELRSAERGEIILGVSAQQNIALPLSMTGMSEALDSIKDEKPVVLEPKDS